MRNDEEGILAGIKIIDANLRCKFAMQMFDPYSSMNSLWTAVVVKFQTAGSCCGPKNGGPACGPACCHGIANLNLLSWNCRQREIELHLFVKLCSNFQFREESDAYFDKRELLRPTGPGMHTGPYPYNCDVSSSVRNVSVS
jgi:hypothetical protein